MGSSGKTAYRVGGGASAPGMMTIWKVFIKGNLSRPLTQPRRTGSLCQSRSFLIHTEKPVPKALRPFNPSRFPFYYGWLIVAVGTLGLIFSIPGQTMGVSVFTDHLIKALGLTRLRISTAYMAGTLCSALLMTRAGRLYDRLGARTTASGAVIFLALLLLAIAFPWFFFFSEIPPSAAG